MATEHYVRITGQTVAIVDAGPTAANLTHYLQGKGYGVLHPKDEAEALTAAKSANAPIYVVRLTEGAPELSLVRGLKKVAPAPLVFVVCDRGQEHMVEALPENRRPDGVRIRPVPFAALLGDIEATVHAHRKAAGHDDVVPPLLFPKLLVGLAQLGRSGRLCVTSQGAQTTIYVRRGTPIFAEQGSLGDTLGRLLLSTGKITAEQFARAVEHITSQIVESEQMRLGEALIALGFLTAEEVLEALREQVERKIVACFTYAWFSADFREGEEHLQSVADFGQPVERLINRGVRAVPLELLDRYLAPFLTQHAHLDRSVAQERILRFGFAGQEDAFLQELTGARTIEQLCESSRLDRVHARQIVTMLLLSGVLDLSEQPSSEMTKRGESSSAPDSTIRSTEVKKGARAVRCRGRAGEATSPSVSALYLQVKGKSDHEVFGVAKDASAEQVDEAYRQLLACVAAARKSAAANAEARRRIEPLLEHIRAAHDRLVAAQQGTGTADATLQTRNKDEAERGVRLEAELSFQEGRQALAAGNLSAASMAFERAATLHPDAIEYGACAAWCSYCTAGSADRGKKGQRALRLAEQYFRRDPSSTLANLVLGHFLREKKRFDRARRHLLIAVKDAVGAKQAEEELVMLERQQRGESGKPSRG